jgi:hypothetical protein
MSLLKTERIVQATVQDLGPVAQRIMHHFWNAEHEIAGQPRALPQHHGYYMPPAWEISVHVRTFRPIGPHRGALKLELLPHAGITVVRASAGVFGMPVGSEQLTWKVKLGQLWREIKQTALHDDVLLVSEEYLTEAAMQAGGGELQPPQMQMPQMSQLLPPSGQAAYGSPVPPQAYPAWASQPRPQQPQPQQSQPSTVFCPECGNQVSATAKFCPECGTRRA